MNQRTDARAAKFVRPKFWQMIKRQFDAHWCSCITLREFLRVVAVLASSTRHKRLYTRFQRRTPKSTRIETSVITAHAFANSSPSPPKNANSCSAWRAIREGRREE